MGFFATVAFLVGLDYADELVPTPWRPVASTTFFYRVVYKDAQRRRVMELLRVSFGDESRGGVATETGLQVDVGDPVMIVGNSLAADHEPTKAEAEAALLRRAAVEWKPEEVRFLPLFVQALAAPNQRMYVEYPERRLAARLMEFRSVVRFRGKAPALWLAVLSVWLAVLGARWHAVLRPPRPNACLKCSYDRAGIAADAVCPECGKAP